MCFCSHCGASVPEGSSFCPVCGTRIEETPPRYAAAPSEDAHPYGYDKTNVFQSFSDAGNTVSAVHDGPPQPARADIRARRLRCPECGSHDLQVLTETNVTGGKGYSGGGACLGWLFFGPFGLLCGNCGKTSVKTTNKTYWICGNCGHKFRNPDELKKEVENARRLYPIMKWILLILGALLALSSLSFFSDADLAGFGIMILAFAALMIWLGLALPGLRRKAEEEYARLQRRAIVYEYEDK